MVSQKVGVDASSLRAVICEVLAVVLPPSLSKPAGLG